MADTLSVCLAFTLQPQIEGGFVDNQDDPGGATNMGITLATFQQWFNDYTLTADDLRDMTVATAEAIYGALYWNPVRADALAAGVDLMVFDMGVNAGVRGSSRLLQQTLGFVGADVDGHVGPKTLAAAARNDARALVDKLAQRHSAFYRSLAGFIDFGRGWLNRVNARQAAALAMIPAVAAPAPAPVPAPELAPAPVSSAAPVDPAATPAPSSAPLPAAALRPPAGVPLETTAAVHAVMPLPAESAIPPAPAKPATIITGALTLNLSTGEITGRLLIPA